MSILANSERITVEGLARVPFLLDLSPIECAPPSVSNSSSLSVVGRVDLSRPHTQVRLVGQLMRFGTRMVTLMK
jgi:hypothetical protein